MEQIANKIAILYDASQAVLATFELDEVLQQILTIARDYFHLTNVAILLKDREKQDLYPRAMAGWDPGYDDIRIALGSVAPVPLRLTELEQVLLGKPVEPELVAQAREMAAAAIGPIDDIRSTARYRSAVASNLVAEFLEQLRDQGSRA